VLPPSEKKVEKEGTSSFSPNRLGWEVKRGWGKGGKKKERGKQQTTEDELKKNREYYAKQDWKTISKSIQPSAAKRGGRGGRGKNQSPGRKGRKRRRGGGTTKTFLCLTPFLPMGESKKKEGKKRKEWGPPPASPGPPKRA